MSDLIKSPAHYVGNGIEPVDFVTSHNMDFLAGNVVKYLVRYRHKGTPLQDLLKAQQYCDWLVERQIALEASPPQEAIRVFTDDLPTQSEGNDD